MKKIAFVFSGQGAQYPGMGQTLADASSAAKTVFDLCDRIRPGTSTQCFTGTKEELTVTSNTQPDMFAVEVAAAAALVEAGITPDALAGFSVGEIGALAFSGALSVADSFRLVCRRGELMQEASDAADTGMTAVVKLSPAQVEALAAQFDQVYPVNYNSPAQTVCAGLSSSMDGFKAAVKEAGGRAIPLRVAGAFHSPFMASAAQGLTEELKKYTFTAPKYTLYSNVTGKPYEGVETYADMLSRQVISPVRWQGIVEDLIANGVDTFIEVGPGNTLTGLIGKIDPNVKTYNVDSADSLSATIQEVTNG
ncbi:MAG: ACP S-malonyltransferase [Oscillospiraceae bacterium]|nr:ACP S-malonyltransferase [Oscillospiraceae bacterium]